MTSWEELLLAAISVIITGGVVLLCIGLIAAPRGIASGPLVTGARFLFVGVMMAAAVAVVAIIFGMVTSWA